MNLLRNRTKVAAKHLASSICGVCVCVWFWEREREPRKPGCVSCGSEKRNKCWSFPLLMTNIRRSRWERGAPKTATFPVSFPRGRPDGTGYSPVVGDGRRSGKASDAVAGKLASQSAGGVCREKPSVGQGRSVGPSQSRCQVRRVIMGVGTAMTDRVGGGRGSDGWVLRLAKFNAWSVTVTLGVSYQREMENLFSVV